jgi:hypothetical protein
MRGFFERMEPERVVHYAQRQTDHRPNENAADRAHLDNLDSSPAYDANGRNGSESGTTKTKTNKGGRCSRREGEDNAAQVIAEAAGGPGRLASRIDFPIHILKKRQSAHRQAMVVRFAFDVLFHQMPGKLFAGPLCLGTVCKSAIDAQRAIDG